MPLDLSRIEREVSEMGDRVNSAVTVLHEISAELRALKADADPAMQARLDALADQIDAHDLRLGTAIASTHDEPLPLPEPVIDPVIDPSTVPPVSEPPANSEDDLVRRVTSDSPGANRPLPGAPNTPPPATPGPPTAPAAIPNPPAELDAPEGVTVVPTFPEAAGGEAGSLTGGPVINPANPQPPHPEDPENPPHFRVKFPSNPADPFMDRNPDADPEKKKDR